ncbi:Hypothetical predicted protein [Podarcis lilfordi]|uniref:Uncharacterized protein n=1 Tax=Podarcis lilfordi TaxID=74358 RepID=A0AA35K0Y1_9SAUR|nr:Hypothetical predicted protein [Podarcis lilfordi]
MSFGCCFFPKRGFSRYTLGTLSGRRIKAPRGGEIWPALQDWPSAEVLRDFLCRCCQPRSCLASSPSRLPGGSYNTVGVLKPTTWAMLTQEPCKVGQDDSQFSVWNRGWRPLSSLRAIFAPEQPFRGHFPLIGGPENRVDGAMGLTLSFVQELPAFLGFFPATQKKPQEAARKCWKEGVVLGKFLRARDRDRKDLRANLAPGSEVSHPAVRVLGFHQGDPVSHPHAQEGCPVPSLDPLIISPPVLPHSVGKIKGDTHTHRFLRGRTRGP